MKVLIVGGGGREHALARTLVRSPSVTQVLAAPGNAGIAELARCHPVPTDDLAGLTDLARTQRVDLVIVGPEAPLAAGLADLLRQQGVPVLGPGRVAAQLEASKAFAKDFMLRHGIPTAGAAVFEDADAAVRYIEAGPARRVVKADGLAAGKGVVVASSAAEAADAARHMLGGRLVGAAGARVVVEDLLVGHELSVMALVDGETVVPLAPAQDHKRLGDSDTGPNTGGMGAVSPPALGERARAGARDDHAGDARPGATADDDLVEQTVRQVLQPAARGLVKEGIPFRGVLYAGLMVSGTGADRQLHVLEFNVRLGDPEAQTILMRLQGDLAQLALAAATGQLHAAPPPRFDPRPAVCTVVAAGGYPQAPRTGTPIEALPGAELLGDDAACFHAGTARDAAGRLVVSGGRILGLCALGDSIGQARQRVLDLLPHVRIAGAQWRSDIALAAQHRSEPRT